MAIVENGVGGVSRRRVLQAGVALGAVLALGDSLRLDPPAPGARILSAEELAVVRGVASAMFPRDPMPLDGIEAGVPEEVDRLVADHLLAMQADGFRYVLRALEWGTLASCGTRFSKLDDDARRLVLDTWADPAVSPRRASFDALKVVFGMAYFNHPAVLRHIGWRTGCGASI